MISEFDIIRRYFTHSTPGTVLGVGDDAALLQPAPGMELAVSTDMLVAGRHFFPNTDPRQLGHKALAVNLSDLAAMGATPRWATLSLALPEADPDWLEAFAGGFMALAGAHGVDLVGGDTTRGPLNICVGILGEVPRGQALRRDRAETGDDVWVSGTLGDAALALAHLRHQAPLPPHDALAVLTRLNAPQPRVALGRCLLGVAHAAIDVSDGLAADLGHILERSGLAAQIAADAVPRSPALRSVGDRNLALACALAGGDDYELCFTAPAGMRAEVEAIGRRLKLPLTRIGMVEAGRGLTVRGRNGKPITLEKAGFDHFG